MECPNCHAETLVGLEMLKHNGYFTCPDCHALMNTELFAEAVRAAEVVRRFNK
jgi:hypothetical protein